MLALVDKAQTIGTIQDGVFTCNDCCNGCFVNLTTFLPTIPEDVRSTITKIHFNDIWIHSIQTNVFRNFFNCIELNMAYNSIRNVDSHSFSGMDSLRKLDLSGNRIDIIPPSCFMGLSALKELYLQDNEVKVVFSEAFAGIPYLEILRLDGNPKLDVNFDEFNGLTYLRELNLSRGRNLGINSLMFQGLHNLVHLELQENEISVIWEESFDDLEKLKVLYLDTNDLEQLTLRPRSRYEFGFRKPGPPLFTRLKSLQVLSVNNNKVKELTAAVFTGLESLQILRINNNSIVSVEKGTFSGLNKLKHLELNFNNLEEISDGMFDGLNSTDEIRISIANNKLKTIPCAPFIKIPRPMILDISENPLICGSDLCWLRQEVETGSIKWPNQTEENQTISNGHVYKPTCADGRNWDDITWDCDQGCKIKMTFC